MLPQNIGSGSSMPPGMEPPVAVVFMLGSSGSCIVLCAKAISCCVEYNAEPLTKGNCEFEVLPEAVSWRRPLGGVGLIKALRS